MHRSSQLLWEATGSHFRSSTRRETYEARDKGFVLLANGAPFVPPPWRRISPVPAVTIDRPASARGLCGRGAHCLRPGGSCEEGICFCLSRERRTPVRRFLFGWRALLAGEQHSRPRPPAPSCSAALQRSSLFPQSSECPIPRDAASRTGCVSLHLSAAAFGSKRRSSALLGLLAQRKFFPPPPWRRISPVPARS